MPERKKEVLSREESNHGNILVNMLCIEYKKDNSSAFLQPTRMGIIDARKTVVLGLSVPSWKLPLLGIEVHKIIFTIKAA